MNRLQEDIVEDDIRSLETALVDYLTAKARLEERMRSLAFLYDLKWGSHASTTDQALDLSKQLSKLLNGG